MLSLERQNKITAYIKQHKSIKVTELASMLYVSVATIRRDLKELDELGLIRKTHGGAVLYERSNLDTSINYRMDLNTEEKEIIAVLALPLLKNAKSIFMGDGSTVYTLAQMYNDEYKSIITNSLVAATALAGKQNLEITFPGGTIHHQSNSVIGSRTIRQLREYFVDVSVMSCSGIHSDGIVSVTSTNQCEINKQMWHNSTVRILLADHTKFFKTSTYRITHIKNYDYVITDKKPDKIFYELAAQSSCRIIYLER